MPKATLLILISTSSSSFLPRFSAVTDIDAWVEHSKTVGLKDTLSITTLCFSISTSKVFVSTVSCSESSTAVPVTVTYIW